MRKLFILLAAVAFVFAFTAPAKAEVSISGYIAMQTYMIDADKEATITGYDDSDLVWNRDQWCSRITFAFKDGPFGAIVELRNPTAAHPVRHWWGTWNFGAGTLGIGQFWTADFASISSAKYDCGAIGGPAGDPGNSVRQNQIQLQLGNLKIGLAEPYTRDIEEGDPAGYPDEDTDTTLPKIMASYDLNMAMVGLKFFGGYQTYDVVNDTDQGYSVDSMVYGLTASAGFGPLTIKGMLYKAQNILEYAYSPPAGYPAVWDGSKIVDADFMSYGLDLQYKVNDAWTVTAGYIIGESELDLAHIPGISGTWEDETAAYHVNATWRVAKNVYITPEYGVVDHSDWNDPDADGDKTEQGKETLFGVYWQIKF